MHELGSNGLWVGEDVLRLGTHAKRVDVRVLEEEQVLSPLGFAQSALQHVGIAVPDAPEPPDA